MIQFRIAVTMLATLSLTTSTKYFIFKFVQIKYKNRSNVTIHIFFLSCDPSPCDMCRASLLLLHILKYITHVREKTSFDVIRYTHTKKNKFTFVKMRVDSEIIAAEKSKSSIEYLKNLCFSFSYFSSTLPIRNRTTKLTHSFTLTWVRMLFFFFF